MRRGAFDALLATVLVGTDGIFLMLHRAMATNFYEDGAGEILRRWRANVTEKMRDLAQILVSFTTYPHVDIRATGLLQRTISRDISPTTLRFRRPTLAEVNGGRTDLERIRELHALARAYERRYGDATGPLRF